MKSEHKEEVTKTFVGLGHMPESIESVDIFNAESLVKNVYFGTIHGKRLNLLRKAHLFKVLQMI